MSAEAVFDMGLFRRRNMSPRSAMPNVAYKAHGYTKLFSQHLTASDVARRGQYFLYVLLCQFRISIADALQNWSVSSDRSKPDIIGDILLSRSPIEIVRRVVQTVSVNVSRMVFAGWRGPMCCGANQSVYFTSYLAAIIQTKNDRQIAANCTRFEDSALPIAAIRSYAFDTTGARNSVIRRLLNCPPLFQLFHIFSHTTTVLQSQRIGR